ncbi:MAG TPA: hypothetical protein VNO30_12565 [Kofleriaceae bacterium]|nr:hypothetical protein [Kofleriaceae bacterium]
MRRARLGGLVLAACAGIGAGIAGADPAPKIAVTAEGGAELDSNVRRSETGPAQADAPIAAPVARLGAKLTHTGRLLRGAYAVAAGAQSQTVLSGKEALSPENMVLLSGDARWIRPVGQRDVSVGLGLTGIDAEPTTDGVGARTFRTLGGDAILALRGGDARSLTVAVGGRDFVYKPEHLYDWRGPTASVRLELTLWERDEGARSLELSALLELEARTFDRDSFANASKCADNVPPSMKESCYTPTSLRRRDRFQRGELELTWTGRFVAAAGYQLTVVDSNSYGQSLVRHRVSLSATRNLPWRLYGTALATLQLDSYPDGLPVGLVINTQTFTATLEDENHSSLQARIARKIGAAWAIESRVAIYRNLGSELDAEYRRFLLSVGAVYSR